MAGSIDLLLTDIVMPKLGGADLVKRLRRLHPRLRAVYMSGFTNDAIARGLLEADAVLLEKPFTSEAAVAGRAAGARPPALSRRRCAKRRTRAPAPES